MRDPEDAVFLRQVLYGVTRYARFPGRGGARLHAPQRRDGVATRQEHVHHVRLPRPAPPRRARLPAVQVRVRMDGTVQHHLPGYFRPLLRGPPIRLRSGLTPDLTPTRPPHPRFAGTSSVHDARKMLPFLSYLFDPSNLDDHCRDEWLKQYDAPFVDNVISRMEAWRDDADAFLEILERQVEDANASRSPGRPIREVRVDGSTSSGRDAGPRLNGRGRSQLRAPPGSAQTQTPSRSFARPNPNPRRRRERARRRNRSRWPRRSPRTARRRRRNTPTRDWRFRLRAVEQPLQPRTRARDDGGGARGGGGGVVETRSRGAHAPRVSPAPEVRLTAAAILREDAVYQRRRGGGGGVGGV